MTPASTSPLAATAASRPKPISRIYHLRLTRVSCQATPDRPALSDNTSNALPAAVVTTMPAYADLNKFEAEQRGEFGIGSADLKYALSLFIRRSLVIVLGFLFYSEF
jgi:hypothetical protein